MFSLAARWGMRDDNPCKGVERNVEHHRRRYLVGDELTRLIKALAEHDDRQAADIIRLLLLPAHDVARCWRCAGLTSTSPRAPGRSRQARPSSASIIRCH